jgi:hypothetical protein
VRRDKAPHDVEGLPADGVQKSGGLALAPVVDFRPEGDQHIDDFGVSTGCGNLKRSRFVRAEDVEIGALFGKVLNNIGVAEFRGKKERGGTKFEKRTS